MSSKMRHKLRERRVSGASQHLNSSEDLGDDQDTDSLEIKPPQAKIMTNYASHRDMGNGSYRNRNEKNDTSRNNNKHKNSISIKNDATGGSIDRETVRLHNEHLERKRESGSTSWRSKEGSTRGSTNILDRRDLQATYRYQKYQDESCREEGYHYHQAQNHYYNQHTQSYHRARQDSTGYHNSRSGADDFQISVPSSSSGSNSKNVNSSNYSRQLEFYSGSEDVKLTEEETYSDRRKRRKAISNVVDEETDEQTEHDLRSRLLNKRYKFIKGYSTTDSEKNKKSLGRSENKAILESSADTQNMEELERERLLLRSLLKGTYKETNQIDESLVAEDSKTNVRSKRLDSARTTHKTQSHAIRGLSPGSVAASVTAGLKDFTAVNFRYDAANKMSTHRKKNIKTDRHEANYAEDIVTDGASDIYSDEAEQLLHDSKSNEESEDFDSEINNHSNNKAKKQKKKKKKKKKRRSSVNNTETQMLASYVEQQVVEVDLLSVHHISSSERSPSNLHRHKSPIVVSISSTKSTTGSPDSSKANRNKHGKRSALSTPSRSASISSQHSQSVESVSESASSCTSRASSQVRHMRSISRDRSASIHSRSLSTHSIESTDKLMDVQKYKKKITHQEQSKEFPNFDVKDKVLQMETDDDEFKLDKIQLTTAATIDEVILDKEDLNLPNYYPGVQGCRSVEEFQCLNRIEEGTYGVVYRAKDKRTNEVVALKRLKMEKEKEGFPITSLREINTLLKGQHPNIVTVREIVVGSNMDKIFIVMDYVEHDLKSLMETMKQRKQNFLPSEVKCIIQQLLRAVAHLHDNWILHRDLKTSNLLLSHKGILKVGDFGLAREYGSPLKRYTLLVVTLWYRAPELLLCAPEYSTPIDMWSVGCIFAELLLMRPLFTGESEIDQINRIFKELGTPNDDIWPGFKELPAVKNILTKNPQFTKYTASNLRKRFSEKVSDAGLELLQGLLTFDPAQRLTAETGLHSTYFTELPPPTDPSMFPTWPAKSELGVRKSAPSPRPPTGGKRFKGHEDSCLTNKQNANAPQNNANSNARIYSSIITGNKKTGTNTGFVLNAGIEQRQYTNRMGFNAKF